MSTTERDLFVMVARTSSIELAGCEHEESWEEPHSCPFQVYEEGNEEVHCVCCEECQMVCFIETSN